jgi:hypothetical protein
MTVDTFLSDFDSLKIPINGVRLPSYAPSNEKKKMLGLEPEASNFDFLRGLCLRGFKQLKFKKIAKNMPNTLIG